ncbi:MAG: zinc-binding dehydrogenase, partial [Actinobacteria bacterium]|nr:zinc-binding dehydrogenase [Actinomycetota bacterium]
MRALVFGVDPEAVPPPPDDADPLLKNLAATPMALQEIPDPRLIGPDWTVLQTRMTGICGSDTKQVLMDTGGDSSDMSMTAFISFPQVLGHEVVADVVETGPEAQGVEVGQRVLLNCWLSCGPRGITPMCPPCQEGDFSQCWHFHDGRLAPGIHTGNSSDATGGFADRLPAHDSMVIPVPDDVPDEIAVLADPFAVSLHGIVRNPPPPGGKAVVWGGGALGTAAIAILRALYPGVDVAAVIRHPAQQQLARKLGATVIDSEANPESVVVALADWSGGVLRHPWGGLPVTHPGHVHVVYDTIGAPQTIEMALRVLGTRGAIVVSGVNAP